jgi:TetR/AcrR family transcriptional regulator, transcriptional repressor for nem operon
VELEDPACRHEAGIHRRTARHHDDIAARLDQTDAPARRSDALTLLGLMLGTLQLARALTDRDLSDQLLARGVETASQLLDDRA